MEECTVYLLIDKSMAITFINCMDFYKLVSTFTNYGEDIEIIQNIKEQTIKSLLPKEGIQEIKLSLATYDVYLLLNVIDFFILVGGFFGDSVNVEDCQMIKTDIMKSLLTMRG